MGARILNKIVEYLEKRIFILFFIFSIVVVVANLSSMSLITEIFSHFKLQYIYICFVFILGFAVLIPKNKSYIIGLALSIFFVGVNFMDLLPSFATKEVTKTQNNIKLALFNVQTHNKNYDKVLLEIEQNSPDIILLQEVDDLWLFAIRSLKEVYPYFIEKERFDNFGVALYSKIPLENTVIEYWTDYEVPVVKTTILAKGKNILFYGIHTLPPISSEYFYTRNKMFQLINEIIVDKNSNIIIAGDLNSTKYSPQYKKFIGSTNINEAHDIVKICNQGSWNAYHIAPMRITLDHILSTKDITLLNYKIGNFVGSDHFPIFVELGY